MEVTDIQALAQIIGYGVNQMSLFHHHSDPAKKALANAKDLANFNAQLNYDYSKKTAENQFMWQRQGLENAHYNPLLAVNGGAGGSLSTGSFANATNPTSATYDQNSPIQNALSLADKVTQFKQMQSNTALQEQQAETEAVKRTDLMSQVTARDKTLPYIIKEKAANAKALLINALANKTAAGAAVTSAGAAATNAATNKALAPYEAHKAKYGGMFNYAGTWLETLRNVMGKGPVQL